jgi:hypothetical protein
VTRLALADRRRGYAVNRLRWALDDISASANRLRGEHERTADTEHAWQALKDTVAGAALLRSHASSHASNC